MFVATDVSRFRVSTVPCSSGPSRVETKLSCPDPPRPTPVKLGYNGGHCQKVSHCPFLRCKLVFVKKKKAGQGYSATNCTHRTRGLQIYAQKCYVKTETFKHLFLVATQEKWKYLATKGEPKTGL